MVPLLNTTLLSIADTYIRTSRPINVNKVVVKKYEKSARVSKKKKKNTVGPSFVILLQLSS